jgi:hypothetical protein
MVWCDLVDPRVPADVEVAATELLAPVVGELAHEIAVAIGATPVPELTGFRMTGVSVEPAGVDRGYLSVAGDVEPL